MNVNVIFVGNLKESYYKEAVAEYEKRLSRYCKVRNIEIKEEKIPNEPNAGEINSALCAEGKRILAALPEKSYRIALCVEGEACSSEQLAGVIRACHSDVTFVIGGSYGLSDEVKKRCDKRISVSKMTFPHRLMRVILAEQIYRAFTINAGAEYHK